MTSIVHRSSNISRLSKSSTNISVSPTFQMSGSALYLGFKLMLLLRFKKFDLIRSEVLVFHSFKILLQFIDNELLNLP